MKIENIGFDEVTDKRIRNACPNLEWNYCEFAVTSKCNFKCKYCNKFTGEFSKDLSLDDIKKNISVLSENKLKYIHFTGGEPTVRKDLCEIVKWAKLCGSRVGISTNGSADTDLYRKLVDNGVELLSISLDANSENINSVMSGKNNIFDTVVHNITEMAKITKVTIGTVINDNNVNEIEKIILFISDLCVNDIRISSATQYNKMLNIDLPKKLLNKHPILNYRISNFKNDRNMRGTCGTDCKNCWMVVDDISIVGKYHFPCMVYAREKGQPIGVISDNNTIKKERFDWLKNHDCTKDPICNKFCMDFKIDYNNKFSKINKHLSEFIGENK